MLEVAQSLVDAGDVGEGAGEAGEHLLEPDHLVAVHHADQQKPGRLGVHALRLDHGDAVVEMLENGENNRDIFTSGAKNLFKYPELADTSKASELISAFEEKDTLAELVKDTMDHESSNENTGIQVYIGNESPVKTMKDCSVVTATYDLGGGMQGTIGIIGPKRMDYENVMDNLKTLKSQLDNIFKKKT